MVIGGWGESLSPGNEQREFWGSALRPTRKAAATTIGVKDPVVDALVGMIIAAPSRESLVARTHALDRVLLWHYYVDARIGTSTTTATSIGTSSPCPPPSRSRAGYRRRGGSTGRRKRRSWPRSRRLGATERHARDARLYHSPTFADHPDLARHHGDQFRGHAGSARRPGRADDRADQGPGGGRDGARRRGRGRRGPGGQRARFPAAAARTSTAARAGSTRRSSSRSSSVSASTSRPWSGSS